MEIIKDTYDNDIIIISNEDGTTISMPKSVYDAMQTEVNNDPR
jgi:hypothetical protein